MDAEKTVPIQNFSDLRPGDKICRMIAGVVPVTCVVKRVEDGLIYMIGGWVFDAATGIEEDAELGSGVSFNYAISYLTRDL